MFSILHVDGYSWSLLLCQGFFNKPTPTVSREGLWLIKEVALNEWQQWPVWIIEAAKCWNHSSSVKLLRNMTGACKRPVSALKKCCVVNRWLVTCLFALLPDTGRLCVLAFCFLYCRMCKKRFKACGSCLSPDPPTNPQLLMDHEVCEGQLVTISCTVESSPPSKLTLLFSTRDSSSPKELFQLSLYQPSNVLNYTFNATWTHNGKYSCRALNDRGSLQTEPKKLVVRCKWFTATLSKNKCLKVYIWIHPSHEKGNPDFTADIVR